MSILSDLDSVNFVLISEKVVLSSGACGTRVRLNASRSLTLALRIAVCQILPAGDRIFAARVHIFFFKIAKL